MEDWASPTTIQLRCMCKENTTSSSSHWTGPQILEDIRPISTQESFPRKKNFVKYDWSTQIFRRKKFWSWKFSTFNNDIFGKFSVRGNFSWVEMGLYSDIIAEQEEKGFIEKVSTTNISDKIHYIPHHPVKKDSTTTPIRIIYDCSCLQSTDHPSLNDCLLSGPPSLNNMCLILLRFQTHPFAFSTDIEKLCCLVPIQSCVVWCYMLTINAQLSTRISPRPIQFKDCYQHERKPICW
jgi:hypothetical protein